MTLPVLISLPHGGLAVPPEVVPFHILTEKEIIEDGDEGASEIYDIENEVDIFVSTKIARAFVDLNRAFDDMTQDGVVKTHTCWGVPVYKEKLPEEVVRILLDRYYEPYHANLEKLKSKAKLCLDCHTMAAFGPPVGPDHGQERPHVCLSNAGNTCSEELLRKVADLFKTSFGEKVSVNHPFRGGHIIKRHSGGTPWIQVEISRAPFMSNAQKQSAFLKAIHALFSGGQKLPV
ncbi:MAG: N-formylglutamate amidohydrolase [Nitrospinota bacterium]|nr:N-formylglutamate amidohydrolase [Nitrospinota bacterium]MDH5677378.1 N-formylglutamate amidohydrolase [Nitrospinota bacterium]MDH5755895.1 N-formylglutamate amidohydrolase [Nitrospinota bacterium]